MTTRGCPYRCTFCSSFTVHGRSMRYRTDENVLAEVQALYDTYGVNLIIPEDDLFTVNRKRVISLLTALKGLNLPDFEMQFPSALSINTLDEEVLDSLIGAGMKICVLAVESGSTYTQRHIIKKNCNLEKAKSHVAYLKKKGIMVRCYFIFGFPAETKELMRESIDFAKELAADWSTMNIAAPLVGTEMYRQFVEMGVIEDNLETWSEAFFGSREFDTEEITADELNELAYRANLEINFLNNPSLVSGNYEKAIDIFDDILGSHPFHLVAIDCLIKCHQGLGNFDTVQALKERSLVLLKTDERARDMFIKYSDLMSFLSAPADQPMELSANAVY